MEIDLPKELAKKLAYIAYKRGVGIDTLVIDVMTEYEAAQPRGQADGVYCVCNPNEAPYKVGSNICAVCKKPRR